MTAATVEAPPSLADVYGLETPTARNAATYLDTIVDVGARREEAERLVLARRAELELYADLLVERFGPAARPNLARLEADDDLLVELLLLAIA